MPKWLLGGILMLAISAEASAQSRYSCSQYYRQCVKINTPAGPVHVQRCSGYRAHCMKTGEWISPKFPAKGLARR
jgi:hypothetical protein